MNPSLPERSPAQAPATSPEALPAPVCDFCHAPIAPHATFHRATLGMNEDGASSWEHVRSVEEVSELVICAGCQPAVSARFDAFLVELWALRQPISPDELDGSPVNLLDSISPGPAAAFDGMALDTAADFLADTLRSEPSS